MKALSHRRVIDVERLFGDLIITFDDGKAAVYSASLLRSILDRAHKVTGRNIKSKPKKRLME